MESYGFNAGGAFIKAAICTVLISLCLDVVIPSVQNQNNEIQNAAKLIATGMPIIVVEFFNKGFLFIYGLVMLFFKKRLLNKQINELEDLRDRHQKNSDLYQQADAKIKELNSQLIKLT